MMHADDFVEYALPGLVSPDALLVLSPQTGIASLLVPGTFPQHPFRLTAQQHFTASEMCVLTPLLECYPHFCPYEMLLARWSSPQASEQDIEACRTRLSKAEDDGSWDALMRPVRNVLSRTRLKLHAFGIDVRSILETGYVLMPRRPERPASPLGFPA